ncbi:hypothetical protein SAMN05660841_03427 [Sphingobacterium nematocida]|uniref:Uncharacterized protein n=1 Tax=Sphingobacterium nematocida TaxID=1513896 RepID=A0A1T5FP19_9SPHI|nr:hypothetical protein [Sphingobacterium nematocida]SKB97842.1 hypothetical protein SAMN05660841_03427 [Sphingobacterium nematocida]
MLNTIINSLQQANKLDQPVEKFTMLVNEKSETQGALYFIPIKDREIKVLLPAPYYKDFQGLSAALTYRQLLKHKEIIVLK